MTQPIRWLHDGPIAHAVRRVDFDRVTAWCGFTFMPTGRFESLSPTSRPCDRCARERMDAEEPHVWGEG